MLTTQKRIISIAALIITLLFIGGFVYFLLTKPSLTKKQPAKEGEVPEDVLKSLTAPAGQAAEVPPDVLKSLTAPAGKAKQVPKDVLDSLTAPAK